jgi:hypothetical protein
MKKLPRGLRLATSDERPGFNATGTCILIRVYEEAEAGKSFAFCSDRRAPDAAGASGFCLDHARRFLDPDEWRDPEPATVEPENQKEMQDEKS